MNTKSPRDEMGVVFKGDLETVETKELMLRPNLSLIGYLINAIGISVFTAVSKTWFWWIFEDSVKDTVLERILADSETYVLITLIMLFVSLFSAGVAWTFMMNCMEAFTDIEASSLVLRSAGIVPDLSEVIEFHSGTLRHLGETDVTAAAIAVAMRQSKSDNGTKNRAFRMNVSKYLLVPMRDAMENTKRRGVSTLALAPVYHQYNKAVFRLQYLISLPVNDMLNMLSTLMLMVYFTFQPAHFVVEFGVWSIALSAVFSFMLTLPMVISKPMQSPFSPTSKNVLNRDAWGLAQIEAKILSTPLRILNTIRRFFTQALCGRRKKSQPYGPVANGESDL